MDITETRTLLHRLLPPCRPSCSLGHFRYFGHQTPLGNVFQSTIHLEHHVSVPPFSMMPAKKGLSIPSSEELYEVLWIIEAELTEDQLLYITGDPVSLGGWEPAMAILMFSTGEGNIWTAKVKMASGVNFKYNYFIRGPKRPLADIVWRPGPEFSLSLPLIVKEDRRVVVRDSWMRSSMKTYPPHFWGSWVEETFIPVEHMISIPIKGKDEIVEKHGSFSEESKQCLHDSTSKEELSDDELMITARNEVFLFSERDQPVEEPWSFQSFLLTAAGDDLMSDTTKKDDPGCEEITQSHKTNQHQCPITENILPEEGRSLTSEEDPVFTVILINSSICTMQRIAVLEDCKLVELLLEPVKNHVQCDSVYLGVVTKLVPHMGGAFVNIGSSRHSLMEIKQYREPLVFPPFQCKAEKQVSDSVIGAGEGHVTAHETKYMHHDVIEIEDLEEKGSQEYDEDNDVEEELNVSEDLKGNTNGSIVDYGEAEADFEDLLDGEHHLDDENLNGFPFDLKGLKFPPTYSLKVSGNTFSYEMKWDHVKKGTKIIVQVVKEGLGSKGPTLTPYPKLRSRFWILHTCCDRVGVSKKISGVERTRLKILAKTLQPQGFGLTVRTVAAGHSLKELQKDLEGLLTTWKNIVEHAKSAALAADEGVEGAIPVILHRAVGQTLSVVQDYFNEKVKKMVVDSPRTYHEVTSYLQEIAPDLCDRVELYDKKNPLFDEFNIEEEINSILSKWVSLPNGGSLVIEQTEALVSIDVNGGHGMFGQEESQEKAILDVNLAAAKQIAREIRLRDIGGIIVVDFIDMADESNKRLVYEEVKKAVERDRSLVKVFELSSNGLMEIIRKRVRPSVTFMISEPCTCCHGTGRVEALETTFSKIEQEICRLLATMKLKADGEHTKSWPKVTLRVDHQMCDYLTSGKKTRLAILSSSLKVWILLKVARGFTRGTFEVKPYTTDGMAEEENQHRVAISMLRGAEARATNSGKKVTLIIPAKKGKVSRQGR